MIKKYQIKLEYDIAPFGRMLFDVPGIINIKEDIGDNIIKLLSSDDNITNDIGYQILKDYVGEFIAATIKEDITIHRTRRSKILLIKLNE